MIYDPKMNMAQLMVWCMYNPTKAALKIKELEQHLNPKPVVCDCNEVDKHPDCDCNKSEEPNPFPDNCIMHDCHECRDQRCEESE